MNIAAIERRIAEGDLSLDTLQYLIGCKAECEWLDYKVELHISSDTSAANFSRDVVAMKNVGGGYLVIGVQDKTWVPVGLKSPMLYDSKQLRDAVRKCTGLDLDIDIVLHNGLSNAGTGMFALILVRGSSRRKKRRAPSVIAKDFHPSNGYGLRRGEIYLRNGDSTVKIQSQQELEDLLEKLEDAADHSALEADQDPSPFAISDGTYRLLEKGFEAFIGRETLKRQIFEAILKDPRLWIIDIHGPGGVGKSAIVNWTVYKAYEQRSFEAILHLSAKDSKLTPSGIKQSPRSLYSLENLLDHVLDLFQEPTSIDLEGKKKMTVELFDSWSTLLVLDNMETVQDGRILKFIQELPASTKCKVLLTSRHKTGGWELPIPVSELNIEETTEFLATKSQESGVVFPLDNETVKRVRQNTGGLPLAIQWTIGQFRITGDLDKVLSAVQSPDSPILEFSFRNIWSVLSADAKASLAVLSIFDSPPDIQQVAIATEWDLERLEKAFHELSEVTLVNANTQIADGKMVYSALPITLAFARNQLSSMGDFEVDARRRVQKFKQQMKLQQWEVQNFSTVFQRFKIINDNEKRAVILCRRAESELFTGNVDTSELLFLQARQTAPNSSYVLALCASGEIVLNHVGRALELAQLAKARVTKETGALVYSVIARIADKENDKFGRIAALEQALTYDPDDVILQHQYGVALSRSGRTADAIRQFSRIIELESTKPVPTDTLVIALRTRIINYRRTGQQFEAAADLRMAKELVSKNPHLQSLSRSIAELEDDSSGSNG